MKQLSLLITKPSPDYELLDSGDGEKLERFGSFILSRPDPQALWSKLLSASEWKSAHGSFSRGEKSADWSLKPELPSKWPLEIAGLKFIIKPTAFKHVGIFPEQGVNWDWIGEKIKKSKIKNQNLPQEQTPEILNLFGYTGGATLACAQAGAKVVHVDGSKTAMAWARENAELSGLSQKPVRWILDDARAFVRREAKRGRVYDGIIMDPPAFGHGPENELWKIEEDLPGLITECLKILSPKPLFFLINGYSAGYSAIAYQNNLLQLITRYGGLMEGGELAIQESSSGENNQSRLLPCGIFARWSS